MLRIAGRVSRPVAWDEKTGYATFEYDQNFKTKGWEISSKN